jgi:CRISPR-associated protein Csh1
LIEAVARIGEYSLRKENKNPETEDGLIDILAQPPNSKDVYKSIITIEVDIAGKPVYKRVGVDELDKKKRVAYLYRQGSASGSDLTPIARVTTPEKTFRNKILAWFDYDYSKEKFRLSPDELTLLSGMKETLTANAEPILAEIQRIADERRRNKESIILSLKLLSGNQSQYLGEVPLFRKIFLVNASDQFYSKYGSESISEGKTCSICLSKREVYGFVSPWAFYTMDKPGFVTGGGFDQSEAWRCNPVCRGCALQIMEGKSWLENHSSFRLYDFKYYIIPKPLRAQKEVYKILEGYHRETAEDGKTFKLSTPHKRLLVDREEEALEELSNQPNAFNCDIMVFEESNKAFRILNYIEGIFPSRLRKLFDAKMKVDSSPLFKGFTVPIFSERKKTGEAPYEFNFGSFWYFFGHEKERDLSGYFLDIVGKTFQGQKVSYPLILWGAMEKIRRYHAQGYPTREATLKAWACLLYLNELGVLGEYTSRGLSESNGGLFGLETDDRVNTAEGFFGEHPEFFDTAAKRATFLVGVISQLLMDIQYMDRSSAPFRVRLQGLKMDQRLVQGLLPEAINKLEEYDKNYYRGLERLASKYFVEAEPVWKMSRDEVSFYFVTGMNLAIMFKVKGEKQ